LNVKVKIRFKDCTHNELEWEIPIAGMGKHQCMETVRGIKQCNVNRSPVREAGIEEVAVHAIFYTKKYSDVESLESTSSSDVLNWQPESFVSLREGLMCRPSQRSEDRVRLC